MATRDDETQARAAIKAVMSAEEAIVTLPCALEFVWVLEAVYRFSRDEVAKSLRALLRMPNVQVNGRVIDVGLGLYAAGGDFADGVIAAEGAAAGADVFVSFDRKAVARLRQLEIAAELIQPVNT